MMGYFKPLRRKIAVFTLALACVFTAGWIKGFWQIDRLRFWSDPKTQYSFCSTPIGISWTKCDIVTGEPRKITRVGLRSLALEYAPVSEAEKILPFSFQDEWEWQWCGFRTGSLSISDMPPSPPYAEKYRVWIVPYWSVVVPLILLSAWLLLVKHHFHEQSSR